MGSRHLDTIREYWRASVERDWETAASCIGPGYTWIDHSTGVVARSDDEIAAALVDALAWSNTDRTIEHAHETLDGTVIVQGVQSCNITGSWRSMETHGQHVSFPICTVFKFDEGGKIILEEQYSDMHFVRQQLGYG